MEKEEGFFYGLSLRTGVISWQAVTWPQKGFANGAVSLYLRLGRGRSDRSQPESRQNLPRWKGADLDTTYSLGLFNWERQVRAGFAALERRWGNLSIRPGFDYSYGDAVAVPSYTDIIYRFMQIAPGLDLIWRPLPIPLEFTGGLDLGLRIEQHWTLAGIEALPGPVVQIHAGLRTTPVALFPASGLFPPDTRYGLSLAASLQYQGAPAMAQAVTWRMALGLIVSGAWQD